MVKQEIGRRVAWLFTLADQIAARVEELQRQRDTREAQLRQTHTLGAHLLESTRHHLLAE